MRLAVLLILLLSSVAFADDEKDLLRLENLNLKLEILARDFQQTKAQRDALQAKIEKEKKEKEAKAKN